MVPCSRSFPSTTRRRGNTLRIRCWATHGFFFHFSAYVLVNLILIAVNLLLTPDQLWFYWPLLGWGIGILAHGLAVNFSAEERVRRRARTRGARNS